MKDEALTEAIKYCGSQQALAKRIGCAQAQISRWDRVPAEKVVDVEKATDGTVPRWRLRPDLHETPKAPKRGFFNALKSLNIKRKLSKVKG